MGYLPAALRNYLVRLGWSHGDEEIFSTEQAVAWFDIDDVNKSPARFDFAKLADVNGHWIRQASPADLLDQFRRFLPFAEDGQVLEARFSAVGWDRLEAALPGLKDRAKTLVELIAGAAWLIAQRPLALDDKAAKQLDPAAKATLAALVDRLEALTNWNTAELEAAVRAHAEATGAKLGALAQPLRAALTGKTVSPPVFDVLFALGRDEALARLRDQAG